MLPGRDRLRQIANSAEGSLTDVPYAVLLAALAVEKRDCLAVLKHRQTEKRVFFGDGIPLECLSNLLHETFGRYLVGQGKIAEEEFQLAFAQANASGLRLGEVLVARGTFPQDEITRLLRANLVRKLVDAFTWNEGTYQLLPDPPEIDSPPSVNVGQLIVMGVSRFAPQAAVDAAIGGLVGKRLALNPEPYFSLDEIRLSEGQARLAAALARRPRIDELAIAPGMPPFDEISRVLYALWLLGTVVTADKVPAAQKPAPPPPAAAPPPPAATAERVAPPPAPHAPPPPAPPSAPAGGAHRPADQATTGFVAVPAQDAAKRRDEMRRAYDTQRNLDSYDLLGLPDDADEAAIRARYLEKARDWAPWQFEGNPSDVGRATALFLAAAKAWGELSDPRSRESLQRSRRVTGQAVTRPVQYFAIKTDVLDPEGQHRKAEELLASGKAKQALSMFELAAECDPQNGSWAADAAWCKYLASDRSNAAATLASLDEAVRIDPRAGVALFYAGEILRARGDAAKAETYYRRAMKLMGSDRRAIDALREMARAAR